MHNVLVILTCIHFTKFFFLQTARCDQQLTVPTKDIQQVTLKTLHFYYTQALNYILPLFYFFLYHRTY